MREGDEGGSITKPYAIIRTKYDVSVYSGYSWSPANPLRTGCTVLRRLTRILISALCTLLVVTMCATAAEARQKKRGKASRVYAITRAGQDWYGSRLLVKWRSVRGASYQLRWSDATSRLSSSKVVATRTAGGTYASGLDRGKTWYFQVRAVKGGAVGPWSGPRGLRFQNFWPHAPTLSAAGTPGGVQFRWGYTPYVSRYRVRWSAAWYGQWPGSASYADDAAGGWVNQYTRQSSYQVPARTGAGDNFLGVEYANPVFAQLEANNAYNSAGAIRRSSWVAQWPTPPAPAPGDPVRMGTYNVMLNPSGARAAAIASNIRTHGVTVVALQEANSVSADAVRSALGPSWARVSGNTHYAGQQILYRKDLFSVDSRGEFDVSNPKSPGQPLKMPWARLAPLNGRAGASQSFYVVSVHFSENASKSGSEKNRDTGLAAQEVMRHMNRINYGDAPVIVAGDMRYGREPYGDPAGYTPAQPTFVRGGYYDAMAAQHKSGHQYSVVNLVSGRRMARQVPHPSGLGPRSDHILAKGIRGSRSYVNVANWSSGGEPPSDHNLVYADLAIPYH